MASRTIDSNLRLPQLNRQSLPIENIPQVNIPSDNGKAKLAIGLGDMLSQAGGAIAEIDRINQQMAAEKSFTDIFLQAQREMQDARDQFTGDEDMTAATLGIYDRYISNIDQTVKNPIQAEYIKNKLTAQRDNVGMMALDYELKFKEKKYDADLDASINNAANIVASEPKLFKDQLSGLESVINDSRLDALKKTEKLTNARQMMGKVYLSRLADLNPAKARAELNSKEMNSIIDPAFKTSLLGKLDNEAKARANLRLSEDISNIDQARRLGVEVPREHIEQVAAQVRAAGNEGQAKKLEKYAELQDFALDFSKKSIIDQQQEIRELQTKAKLGDLYELDRLETAAESFNEKLKSLKSDPWDYYAQKGIIDPQQDSLIDANPQSAADIIAQRRLAQEKVNVLEKGNVRLPLLTPQETAQLTAMKDTTDPKQLASTLTRIGTAMSGEERRATMAAVSAKEPLLAVAMGQDFDKASRLLAGRTAKAEVTPAKVREKTAEKLKGLTVDGTINDALHDAVYAYYTQLALEKGQTSKEAQSDLVDQAVRDVVGNIVDVNVGKPSRIIAPAGYSAFDVEDRLGSITDDVLKSANNGQLPLAGDFRATAKDILDFGKFETSGDGEVAVRFPTGVLYRDDGKLFTIRLNQIDPLAGSRAKQKIRIENSRMGVLPDANQ